MSAWVTPSFSAADYTAFKLASSPTWTVGSSDVTQMGVRLVGKQMTIVFKVETSDINGNPDALLIAIPYGRRAKRSTQTFGRALDVGTARLMNIGVGAGSTKISLGLGTGVSWNNTSTGGTSVSGQLDLEVTTATDVT